MIKFGTGGWRAVIGDDFTSENIRRVAAGVLQLAKEENKTDKPIIIGYDRRFLSQSAAVWVAEVLAQGGIEIWFLERSAPTPLIMHTVKDKELYFGIEITASHNPANYNGIKLIVEEGRDAPVETTERLEQLIESLGEVKRGEFDSLVEQGRIIYQRNPFNKFLDDIIALLDMDALRERGLRVIFDTMHGSGSYPLQVILYTARCTVDTINFNKDAFFGGKMPAPNEQTLGTLSSLVIEGGYDFGIALDGDGDRLGIIDSNGRYISANEILCLLYYYFLQYKGWKGPAVRNFSTTHMLDKIAENFGEKCYEVPVGFKHISAKIDETDAVLGGESSGGLTVRGHIHGKDSIYAASLFAEMVSVTGKSPSDMLAELEEKFGKFVMVEDNMRFSEECKKTVSRIILEEKRLPDFGKKIVKTDYSDGCKAYFEDGSFIVCRFSGTEPLLRICAESPDLETSSKYISELKNFLNM